ncbi:transcriptional regulatory protein [Klebsiella pneumoniae]|nr:transcriptional regulatory protein [Klebsiella pneumoniae]
MAASWCYHRHQPSPDEANLIQLLMEGKQRGIAGMVILTGEAISTPFPPR